MCGPHTKPGVRTIIQGPVPPHLTHIQVSNPLYAQSHGKNGFTNGPSCLTGKTLAMLTTTTRQKEAEEATKQK
jgi:hypothetical protein